ncbi:MAG TPA: AtpZ/AtpI family protein [Gemmatimonadaceae bacterium]|nr:AtpZ/AtpI family protein [Gemmatimonadaceae bacterium]
MSLRKISQSPKFRLEMSGDRQSPSSGSAGTGTPRQNLPDTSPPAPTDQDRRERSSAARYASAGFQFAITLLLGLALGYWADKKYGSSYFTFVGVFVGAGAAFYSMYRQLMGNLERDENAKRARARAAAESSASEPKKREPREDA